MKKHLNIYIYIYIYENPMNKVQQVKTKLLNN
jgi:hypothetical protein